MQQYTLEKHWFFPYVAWTLIICFALFTLSLTMQLQEQAQSLKIQTEIPMAS